MSYFRVRFRETAAELDDRDGLAGPVSPAGERVEGGDLRRGVGDGLRGGVVAAAQLGPGLRAAVQPENRDHDPGQLGGALQAALAAAVRDRPCLAMSLAGDQAQGGSEGPRERRNRPGHRQPPRAGIAAGYLKPETEAGEHVGDQRLIGGIRAVTALPYVQAEPDRDGAGSPPQ